MAEIKDVKVWHNSAKTEWRVYVHTTDGREGCKYLTGNGWNPKGSVTGGLTDEEWQAAREIAVRDGKWHTVYENEIPGRIAESASRAIQPEILKNRRAQHCNACGRMVEAGQGSLVHVGEEDTQLGPTGWLVYHLDQELCQSYQQQDRAETQAEKVRKETLEAEARELSEQVAKETGLSKEFDWSFDDYRFSLGDVLSESEHYVAREYLESGNIIGFTIKQK